jgi:hypothetical protein
VAFLYGNTPGLNFSYCLSFIIDLNHTFYNDQ